jgi:hypothetical protein
MDVLDLFAIDGEQKGIVSERREVAVGGDDVSAISLEVSNA